MPTRQQSKRADQVESGERVIIGGERWYIVWVGDTDEGVTFTATESGNPSRRAVFNLPGRQLVKVVPPA